MSNGTKRAGIIAAVLLAVVLLSTGAPCDDLSYIRGKLQFLYVADPNASGATADAVNIDQITRNQGTGGIYTEANVSKFRDMIKALLGSGVSGVNQSLLRSIVAQTLRITDKPIGIYLVNDNSAAVTNSTNTNRFGICLEDNHAWPCAICYTTNRDSQTWGGSLSIGAWHLNNTDQFSTMTAVLETLCHELMHTQDLSDGRAHIFGIHSYGQDQTHYFVEAIPNMAMTYSEGIANFAGYWFNTARERKARRWFANNDYIIVEKNPPSLLYNSLHSAGIPEVNPATTTFNNHIKTSYAVYRIRSLPVNVISRNEQVLALILYEQAFYSTFDDVMAAIKQVNPNTFQVTTSAWAQLIEELCRRGLPTGVADCDQLTSSTAGPKRYLLPLAICDYFTAFRSTSSSQFSGIFENMIPQCWIDAYWQDRSAVRGAVNMSSLSDDDVTNIAIALGITQSVQP